LNWRDDVRWRWKWVLQAWEKIAAREMLCRIISAKLTITGKFSLRGDQFLRMAANPLSTIARTQHKHD
jgi:hypothetical protein